MKRKTRWKHKGSTPNSITYQWDDAHEIFITRDEYNNWSHATLNGGRVVELPQSINSISDVAKILGVH